MMKRSIIISIKKNFSTAIIDGKKIIELRKRIPKEKLPLNFFIYETKPTQSIVAMVKVRKVEEIDILNPRSSIIKKAYISNIEFHNYFKTHSFGYALEISQVKKLTYPIPLREIKKIINGFVPPQSFRYIDSNQAEEILRRGK